MLAEEVVYGYIKGCLGRCIMGHGAADAGQDFFPVVYIKAYELRRHDFFNGGGYGGVTITGNDYRCRCAAPADSTVICVDLDDQVFCRVDTAQGRNKRYLQGN